LFSLAVPSFPLMTTGVSISPMFEMGGSDGPLNEEGCLSGYGNVRGCFRREKCAEKSAFNARSALLHVAS